MEYAGFFGEFALGASYEVAERHRVSLSLGTYAGEDEDNYQINALYQYAPWQIRVPNKMRWTPTQVGVFTVLATNRNQFFLKSPEQYPSRGYYDGTAYRWGLEVGSLFSFDQNRWDIGYHFRLIDVGIIALYNNAHRDIQYFISSGLSLHYRF